MRSASVSLAGTALRGQERTREEGGFEEHMTHGLHFSLLPFFPQQGTEAYERHPHSPAGGVTSALASRAAVGGSQLLLLTCPASVWSFTCLARVLLPTLLGGWKEGPILRGRHQE